jgi:hypothetical protein
VLVGVGAVLTLLAGALTVAYPEGYRVLLALAIAGNLLLVAVKWPRAGAFLTLLFLPFLALIRRLLIADAGWTTYDPLLLVAPLVALFLLYRASNGRGLRIGPDTLSKLVAVLMGLLILQSLNPLNPTAFAGVAGLVFLVVPMLWFFIGRELGDRQLVLALLCGVIVAALAVGFYGWWQTEREMPSWDAQWVDVAGYGALNVGDKIRGFSTFSSSAEYAAFLGIAIVFAVALALHRRALAALAAPLLMVPLVLSSVRATTLLTLFAVIVMIGLLTRKASTAAAVVTLGIAATVGALFAFGPALERLAASSGNALIIHEVEGLVHPFDSEKSTLEGHRSLVVDGFERSFQNPVGEGTAVMSGTEQKLGGAEEGSGTEVDISNAFVGLGLAGGLVFLATILVTFRQTMSAYIRGGDPLVLAVTGLLVAILGQWLQGRHYAVVAITWFLVGWATRPRASDRRLEPGSVS